MEIEKIKDFINKNKLLLICFFLVTIFFCWQNYWQRGWDFSVYVLNGKYLFYNGEYFEVYRPPLAPFLLGIFWFFGEIGNFFYIIFVSSLFLISSIILSDFLFKEYFKKYNLKKEEIRFLFYLLILNPFTLYYSLIEGTELLALSFFILFTFSFLSKRVSGHFLALSFLSRYNFLIFFPFLFFSKDIKRILKNLVAFFSVIFPWLFFNYLKYGNWFASILDSYYLNIYRRVDISQSFDFFSLLKVSNFYSIFLVLGISYFLIDIFKKRNLKEFKYKLFFILLFLVFLYDIIKTPFKIERYLFNISLPFAFFSLIGVLRIKKESLKRISKIFILTIFLTSTLYMMKEIYTEKSLNSLYEKAAKKIKELGLENCEVLSHHWAPLSYFVGNARFQYLDLNNSLKESKISVIFLNYPTVDDLFKIEDVKNYPSSYSDENFVIIGKKENCSKREKTDYPMLKDFCGFVSSLTKDKLKSKEICLLFNKK